MPQADTERVHGYAGTARGSRSSLWVLCSAYLFLVPANVYFQSVSGTGNTRTALALEMITLVVYTCYITYIVAYLKLDVAFAWTSEIVYSVGILVLCYFYMKKGNGV